MTRLLLMLITLLCAHGFAQSNRRVGAEFANSNFFSVESSQLAKHSRLISRKDSLLVIRLKSGRTSTLNDSELDIGQYFFFDHIKSIGYLLFRMQYGEGNDYLLLNDSTGLTFVIADLPVLSPDGRRIVTANFGEPGYVQTAIQIWRLEPGKLVNEWSVYPKEWGPSDAYWLNQNTIRVNKNVPDNNWNYHQSGYIVIEHLNGRWQKKE